ncbi:MAG TPA: NUDIX domain-containing protein [Candidatus Saccharibacteria bacterium]|nr:NUDIX domain-containing protein [Candidatus Saccharibacteria bacterium]
MKIQNAVKVVYQQTVIVVENNPSSSDALEHPLFRAAVFAMVFDDQNRVLLHERAGTNFLPGYWDFPSGHVEKESFTAAAVRELSEESGLSTTEADIELAYLGINLLDQSYVNAIYRVLKWHGTPKIMEPEKCSGMQFFALDALPTKLTLGVRLMMQQQFQTSPAGNTFVDLAGYQQLMGEPFQLT